MAAAPDDRRAVALDRWREAEREYIRAAARFLNAQKSPPTMSKADRRRLRALREKADRLREKYFVRQG